MKARNLLWYCCFAFGFSFAQTDISSLEYFFDADPGFGNGVSLDINPDVAVLDQNFSITTSGLPEGTHRLFIRAINVDGTASLLEHKTFRVAHVPDNNTSDLVEAEYFFNQDPGVGMGTAIDVVDGAIVDENLAVPTTSLPEGTHRLFIRAINVDGTASLLEHKTFRVAHVPDNNTSDLVEAEYFFNQDPGVGMGTAIDVVDGAIVDENLAVPTTSLPEGTHRLFIRAINVDGTASLLEHKTFRVAHVPDNNTSDLVEAEYFFNQDPGVGMGTAIDVVDGAIVDENLAVPTTSLPEGTHRLFIRAINVDGTASLLEHKTFRVAHVPDNNTSDLVEAEYFFNQDPGVGMGTAIDVVDGAIVDETLAVPTTSLPVGTHRLYVRTKNASNTYSLYEHKTFRVAHVPDNNTADIVAAEYFVDIDPGFGSANSLSVSGNSIDANVIATTTGGLAQGDHYLYIRTKNSDNEWSLYERQYFEVDGVLGIVEEQVLTSIKVYPNPVVSNLRIELSSDNRIELVRFYDLSGKLVKTNNDNDIDVSELSSGVYLINVQTKKGVVTKRIVKK